MRLAVALDRPGPYTPGAAVSGRVRVEEGGSARELTVELVRTERSPDYAADHVADGAIVASGSLGTDSAHVFTLTLPVDAGPTVQSAHGGLGWEVRAHADRRGRDAHGARAVEVRAPDTF